MQPTGEATQMPCHSIPFHAIQEANPSPSPGARTEPSVSSTGADPPRSPRGQVLFEIRRDPKHCKAAKEHVPADVAAAGGSDHHLILKQDYASTSP